MSDNPFLLPRSPESGEEPGSDAAVPVIAGPVKAVPVPAVPAPQNYIAIPASVESGTHRISRPETEPTTAEVAPAAAPAPAPTAPPAPASSPVSVTATPPLGPEVEDTRVAPPRTDSPLGPRRAMWALVLPDGARIVVDRPVLLGRDPAPLAERPDAHVVSLVDRGKTVSKTHALVEPHPTDPARLLITDLHSTNGVAVTETGMRTVLAAGGTASAGVASMIELGAFTLVVGRS